MKHIHLASLALSATLAGCSTTPVATSDAKSVEALRWSAPVEGSGTLIVKRDSGFMGGACSASVYVDGALIGELWPSRKLTVYLPPGEHLVGARNGSLCGGAVSEGSFVLAREQLRTYRIAILDAGGIAIQPTAF